MDQEPNKQFIDSVNVPNRNMQRTYSEIKPRPSRGMDMVNYQRRVGEQRPQPNNIQPTNPIAQNNPVAQNLPQANQPIRPSPVFNTPQNSVDQSSFNPPAKKSRFNKLSILKRFKLNKKLVLIGVAELVILLIAVVGVYSWQHSKVTYADLQVNKFKTQTQSLESSSQNLSGANVQVYARNAQRQANISSIQTELEAYFSQRGFYPRFSDMNNSNWVKTNLKNFNPNILIDPSNPKQIEQLAPSPTPNQYSYQVTDLNGNSCESNEQSCSLYTLTAMFEGQFNGQNKYIASNAN